MAFFQGGFVVVGRAGKPPGTRRSHRFRQGKLPADPLGRYQNRILADVKNKPRKMGNFNIGVSFTAEDVVIYSLIYHSIFPAPGNI